MAELTLLQVWIIVSAMVLVFLAGLCWCFCCGTCIGRSMLRNTGLLWFVRGGADNRQWQHLPQQNQEEELGNLNTWLEDEEETL